MKDALKKNTFFLCCMCNVLPAWLLFMLLRHPPGPPTSAEVIFLGLLFNSCVSQPLCEGSRLLRWLLEVFPVPKLRAGELSLPLLSDVECLGWTGEGIPGFSITGSHVLVGHAFELGHPVGRVVESPSPQ